MSDNKSPYIEIIEVGASLTGRTKIWEVRNISKGTSAEDIPGLIKWRGAWRGYVYECEASFYDAKCLRQIADFIEMANKGHMLERLEHQVKTCERKKNYAAESRALATIHAMGKDAKLKAYKCDVCNGWHIGHIVPRAVRMAP